MPDAIVVEGGVFVPGSALEMKAVRSSGPGGQNINKVASKVELRVDISRIQGMDAAALHRLYRIAAGKLDQAGKLVVTSQKTRDQFRNLEDARRKVHDWIVKAIKPPRKRIATMINETIRERRLEAKRLHSKRKANRRQSHLSQEEDAF